MPRVAPVPRVCELLTPHGAIRPPEPRPRSLHLNYRNDCVIISRALISSPPGGYMVHAARENRATARFILRSRCAGSKGSSTTPFSRRHSLIDVTAIRNARNSPENNQLNFSNRLKNACSGAHSAPKKSPITTQNSVIAISHPPLFPTFLIASRQIIKNRSNPFTIN